jgi:hypothetical protein
MTTEHPAGDGRSQPGQRALGAMESAVQRARASQGLPTPVAAGGPPPPPVAIPPEPPERCRLDRAAARRSRGRAGCGRRRRRTPPLGVTRAARTAAFDALLATVPAPVLAKHLDRKPWRVAERSKRLGTDWRNYVALRVQS